MRRAIAWCVWGACAWACAWPGVASAERLGATGVDVELGERWEVEAAPEVDVVRRVRPALPRLVVQLRSVDGRGEVDCGGLLRELASRVGGERVGALPPEGWYAEAVRFRAQGRAVGESFCARAEAGRLVIATALFEGGYDTRGYRASVDEVLGAVAVGLGHAPEQGPLDGLVLSSAILGLYSPAQQELGHDTIMGGLAVYAVTQGQGVGWRTFVDVSLAGGLGPGLYLDVGGGGGVGLGAGPLDVSLLLGAGADWLGTLARDATSLGFGGWLAARGHARLRLDRVALDAHGGWHVRSDGLQEVRAGARASLLGVGSEYGWGLGAEWRGLGERGWLGLVTVGISY